MEARELVNRITFEGQDNMRAEVYVMSEDTFSLVPFDVFSHEGKIVFKPRDKRHGIKLV